MQSKLNRAKQFLPFDALTGFKETILEIQKVRNEKCYLSFDQINEINYKLKSVKLGNKIKVKYYYLLDYIETIGIVKKMDNYKQLLLVGNSIIFYDDILDIEIL